MSDIPRIWPKTAPPNVLQRTIDTMAIAQHGVKQAVSVDSVAALRYQLQDGKLVMTPILHSEMYLDLRTGEDDEDN